MSTVIILVASVFIGAIVGGAVGSLAVLLINRR